MQSAACRCHVASHVLQAPSAMVPLLLMPTSGASPHNLLLWGHVMWVRRRRKSRKDPGHLRKSCRVIRQHVKFMIVSKVNAISYKQYATDNYCCRVLQQYIWLFSHIIRYVVCFFFSGVDATSMLSAWFTRSCYNISSYCISALYIELFDSVQCTSTLNSIEGGYYYDHGIWNLRRLKSGDIQQYNSSTTSVELLSSNRGHPRHTSSVERKTRPRKRPHFEGLLCQMKSILAVHTVHVPYQ